MPVLRGYFHSRCAQSRAAEVLPQAPLSGSGQGGAPAPLAGQTGERDYFRGPEHVQRVRVWRLEHPGYWRTHRRGRGVALQDALALQVIEGTEDLARRALQDALRSQGPVLIGLIAHLSDSALQDDIASTTRRLLELGQDILSGQTPHAAQTSAAS
jgi:hypothetical protein